MSRPTIHDVARIAGVSLSTVDRVLNGRVGVRGATEVRVKQVMKDLGYERNIAAANLSRRREYRLLFILPSGSNSFMRKLQKDIESQEKLWNFTTITLMVVPPFDDVTLITALRDLDPKKVDGVALVATDSATVRGALADLRRKGIAVVTLVSDLPSSSRQYFVGIDNVHAGRTAASLLGRFCRGRPGRIAVVAGSMLVRDHAERRLGFEQVIRTEFPEQEVLPPVEGLDDQDVVERKLRETLDKTPDIVGIYSLGAGNRGIAHILSAFSPETRPSVVVHELTSFSREALLDRTFDAVIHQDTTREAMVTIRLLRTLIDGAHVDADSQRIAIEIYLRDNLS